jgi:ribose 5-phosphate isomerase B
MKVGVGADHGGFEMKEQLAKLLTSQGHEVIDFGNKVLDRHDDYPDFAFHWPARWPMEMWNAAF